MIWHGVRYPDSLDISQYEYSVEQESIILELNE